MNEYMHIQFYIDRGYELSVKIKTAQLGRVRSYHAAVYHYGKDSHNYLGDNLQQALAGLNKYLENLE